MADPLSELVEHVASALPDTVLHSEIRHGELAIRVAPDEAPPVISAQIFGQSDTAETAGSANIAGKARAAYLGVEWSGPADRRTRRGRIAKTDV